MRTITRLAVVGITALGVVLPTTAASATDAVTRSGACSGNSDWSLRAAEALGDNANLRLRVDSPRAGQTWDVTLRRQGDVFHRTTRVSNEFGNFTVNRQAREVNDVNDVYTARARNRATGETCFARVVLPD